ncbi:hypothetical protein PhCBS80983_g00449 [Powellomyces hirtus]|uniref:Uncharacterized protein n=1 Tax=Powellomyces hirtus TaxID=109895 RepID=A0A507EFY6_9FUNG|nr:hypothetical protein PhCBS80983_g00449 [Powellomyces hirtus]
MRFTTAALTAFVACLPLSLAQATTAAGCAVSDIVCLSSTAQYTVLANVVSNNANSTDPGASPAAYNATVSVSCVYGSFGSGMGTGDGLVGQQVLVTGFGNPRNACPGRIGAEAPTNFTGIFFIYVANRVGQGQQPVYTVFNPCGGPIVNSPANLLNLQSVLDKNPTNRLLKGNCIFPTPAPAPAVSGAGPTATAAPTNTPLALDPANSAMVISHASILSVVAAGLVGVLTVVFA